MAEEQATSVAEETSEDVILRYADRGGGVLLMKMSGEGIAYWNEVGGTAAIKQETRILPLFHEGNLFLSKSEYRTMIKWCRFLAESDGLASNFVEIMVEMNAGGFENRVSDKAKKHYADVFNTFCKDVNSDIADKSRGMDEVRKKFQHAWWTTGLMVWLKKPGQRGPISTLKSKKFKMPIELELLECSRIDLDELKSKGIIGFEFSDVTVKEIKNYEKNGGNLNLHPLLSLWPENVKNDPLTGQPPANAITREEAIKLIIKGKSVPLPPDKVIMVRRVFNDSQIYPVPFLVRYFPAVQDKLTLRAIDRSLMR